MIVTYVSLGTFVVVIGNTAVADPAGTITNEGTAAAGLSLTNAIVVCVGTGAFSVTVADVVTPPFTAGDAKVTLSNELLGDVGCVGGAGCVGETPTSLPCGPHAATMTAATRMNRPMTTAPF